MSQSSEVFSDIPGVEVRRNLKEGGHVVLMAAHVNQARVIVERPGEEPQDLTPKEGVEWAEAWSAYTHSDQQPPMAA
jgi:hypothetical protein